jgi:Integrase core domain.
MAGKLFDSILTVTDKFTKAVRLIPGKDTYTAVDWAMRYWQCVYPDWGLPTAFISDRDPKFLSEFWKTLFRRAGTKILASTAYHPQTMGSPNGQTKPSK